MEIYVNGQFHEAQAAQVSAEDAGLQHAVGLFETMAALHGRVFRLHEHVQRMLDSAKALGLWRDLDADPLRQAVRATLAHNRLEQARVRLTVTPGRVSMLTDKADDAPPSPTVLVIAAPPTAYDPACFAHGISALIAPPAANPFDPLAGHKTLSYWGRLRMLRQAASAGAGEAIWLNITNHLAGGAISNLFLVRDDELHTPLARGEEQPGALAAPVLPGITRAAVIELAQAMAMPVHRRMLTVTDLLDADEVFLTNSSWQLLPVTRVEKKPIGDGTVGEMTQKLRAALLALIEKETGTASAAENAP